MAETKVINGKEYTWETVKVYIKGVEIKNIVPMFYEGKPTEVCYNGLIYSIKALRFILHNDQRIYGKLPKRTSKKQLRQLVKRI